MIFFVLNEQRKMSTLDTEFSKPRAYKSVNSSETVGDGYENEQKLENDDFDIPVIVSFSSCVVN